MIDNAKPDDQLDQPNRPDPLRSVHTSNLPEILEQLGITILVTTYQAGKLVMLRSDGQLLNTHFRMFEKPMGLAVDPESHRDRHVDAGLGVPQHPGGLCQIG